MILDNSESPSGRALFDQKLQDKIFQVFKALGAKSPTTLQEVVDLQMRPSRQNDASKMRLFSSSVLTNSRKRWTSPSPDSTGIFARRASSESLSAKSYDQQYVFNDFNYQL